MPGLKTKNRIWKPLRRFVASELQLAPVFRTLFGGTTQPPKIDDDTFGFPQKRMAPTKFGYWFRDQVGNWFAATPD